MATALRCSEATGLAAGYVLGALAPQEMVGVRDHLASCDQPHPEFAELGGVVPYLADLIDPVEPPAALATRIHAAAEADLRARARDDRAADRLISALGRMPARPEPEPRAHAQPGAGTVAPVPPPVSTTPTTPTPNGPPTPAAPTGPATKRRWAFPTFRPAGWAFGLAALALIVVLAASNVLLQRDVSASRDYADHLTAALALAAQPGSRVAILAPGQQGSATGGLAVIPARGGGVVVMHDLPPTSGSQVYEAWVIVGQAAPTPAGSFQVWSDGKGWLVGVPGPPAQGSAGKLVIALTREPGPGATRPTLPIISSGQASNVSS